MSGLCDVTYMNEHVRMIAQRIAEVYHMSQESAEAALRKSHFFTILSGSDSHYQQDSAEVNFRRYQNEIEYGAWNRNEFGEIVE